MSKLIPRKIKKACKAYRNKATLKTRWLRYVNNQISGQVDKSLSYANNRTVCYKTKNGEILDEYILFGNNIKYRGANNVKSKITSGNEISLPAFVTLCPAPKKERLEVTLHHVKTK